MIVEPESLTGQGVTKPLRASQHENCWLTAPCAVPGRKADPVQPFLKKAILEPIRVQATSNKHRVRVGISVPMALRIVVWLTFFVLTTGRVYAQEQDDIARLKEVLESQQALNEKLLERIEALEAGQGAILAKIQSVEKKIPDKETLREERDTLIEELHDEYIDLQDKLDALPRLSGYYDFENFNDNRNDSPGEFRQHHLSLHLTKEWDRWRVFSEFEFEFGAKFEGAGGTDLEEARGEIKLEQAWGEYVHSDTLTLRGGLILTPGYWNVNDYPNVVLSTRRPLVVRKVFRESIIGVMGYGDKYWDDFGVTYYGYVGNGQSDFFTKNDDNEGKAVGGRMVFHLAKQSKLDTLDFGLSMYHESPSGEERVFTWGVDV